MENSYLIKIDEQLFGPYQVEQLHKFQLLPDTQVFSTLSGNWGPVSSFPELANIISLENNIESNISDIYKFEYFYQLNGDIYGPFSIAELAYLDINQDSILSVDNMQSWQTAGVIPDLIDTLSLLIQANNPIETPNANLDASSLNKEELEQVIEIQEEDILYLKDQLNHLESNLKNKIEQISNKPVYDLSINGVEKYSKWNNDICAMVEHNIYTIEQHNNIYTKVFSSPDYENSYYIGEYTKFISSIISSLQSIEIKMHEIQASFDNDIMLLENKVEQIYNQISNNQQHEEQNLIDSINQQINSLNNPQNEITVESLTQYLNKQQAEISSKFRNLRSVEIERISAKRRDITQAFNSLKQTIISHIQKKYDEGNSYFESYFETQYETAKVDSHIWSNIKGQGELPSSTLRIGHKSHRFIILDQEITITENHYINLLNNKNLILRYNNETKEEALKATNAILGRLMVSSTPGKLNVLEIDSEEMDGTCDEFKYLNRNVFQILSRNDEIRKSLDEEGQYIGNIIQNLLLGPLKSLHDYNQAKENKEPYHILVIEDFPIGVNNESATLLQKILKNGIRAGVNVILMINEDKINYNEDSKKAYNLCNIEQFQSSCITYDFVQSNYPSQIIIESFSEEQFKRIVQYVNAGVEIRKEEAILFTDYMLPQSEWWSRYSAKYIDVPFGVSVDRQVQRLKITQESGQNSAVVIGIPGSGKSVFLHTLICNAAINYSPDELNMYLIDFSGVEFNSYALKNLPHARVIAPEAEREFGLSVLNELVEEGARRMELCRNNGVSNIVDLKAANPSLYIPRLLVIIDEFQKIFEIENDQISREANSKIHMIIQEFRKFGINLILATQKLPSSSILPKDLIANRVVFKSSPADFSALISMPTAIKTPQLNTGECIYNSESGSPYDNHKAQGFLITKSDIDKVLIQMTDFAKLRNYKKRHELVVFRGNDLPNFSNRRISDSHNIISDIPSEIGIYFGESIAINKYDIYTSLRKESGNNILIIGGESHVAQRITYYATLSATTAHSNQSASFIILNFMRPDDALNEEIIPVFESIPFPSQIISRQNNVIESLSAIKEEINERRNDENRPQNHIYISIFAFQLARMFDKGGRRGDDVSECGLLLDFILKNGSAVGVFTILQCDNWDNLTRIGNPLSSFAYRIALQMPENDSNKIMGSSIAHKLHVFNRPSSIYRAYFRDHNRNITIKFKPYK